jgi:uncharacterized membrane-anchored protein
MNTLTVDPMRTFWNKVSQIALVFWIAYILTRPFGASCGDLLSQPVANGGLGLGTINTSAVFMAAILFLVSYLATQARKSR